MWSPHGVTPRLLCHNIAHRTSHSGESGSQDVMQVRLHNPPQPTFLVATRLAEDPAP